jgi:2-succinyl-5-enolpyruvyl-6-hydroxy-3-cyclohexene-1-carboxylate synthase
VATYVDTAAAAGARIVTVDPQWQWTDPGHVATETHIVDPDVFIGEAIAAATPTDPSWLARWITDESAAQAAIMHVLGTDATEPQIARRLAEHAANHDLTIVVSASMPMRDLEWFAPALPTAPRVLANRGANGIDGVVSTALGVAASGTRVVALLGDLAFLHDVSGLVNLPRETPCTFVVLDNGGGGIFSFLPQAGALASSTFEQLFGTPPTSDVAHVARGFGLPVVEVDSLPEFDAALARATTNGSSLIRVKVPGRSDNVALHDALNQAVRLAVR